MNDDSQEIEVKYQVTDTEALLGALKRAGVSLRAAVRQDDQAYAPASWDYDQSKIGVPFARLRTQTGLDGHLFTVKKPVDNELACLEQETVVFDRDAMHQALLLMGWAPTVRIAKTRQGGAWRGVALCVDVVDGLGTFLELEVMVAAGRPGAAVQAELAELAESLGVDAVRVTDTYDSLLRRVAV
ncbi:class IV adenylate cyclase [Longispora sp. NPDC051575]|uniref:class IV adenylate cyclase n=1 Tax=Longispora sp. NPDC051575 TaxID=3154943 RepID=UPI00342043E2